MGFLQILMNSASKSKNNLLCASHLSQLDSRKGSAFVEISLTRTYNSKIKWLHTRLKWIFFTNWSDNDVAEPFFWQQPAFLRDHYQPFTGSRHFATYIQALQPRFHKTHHAARTLNLSPHAKRKQNRTRSSSFFYFFARCFPCCALTNWTPGRGYHEHSSKDGVVWKNSRHLHPRPGPVLSSWNESVMSVK